MYNILYLDENITYYYAKTKKIIRHEPLYGTLENGLIIDVKKFYKSFKKMLKNNNIKSSLFYDKLIIITPPNFNNLYKYIYKEIFNNLNYKFIIFKNEKNFYKISKNIININVKNNYFYYSENINGKVKTKLYNIEDLERLEFKNNITYYIYGIHNKYLINKLEKSDCNYYLFQDSNNYFINSQK